MNNDKVAKKVVMKILSKKAIFASKFSTPVTNQDIKESNLVILVL